jgi:DNA helicase-2/ATP-dependent DNA helicase PcrA
MAMQLNPEQERAASHRQGPCLVTAGPGTGKTRVLVERAARLMAEGSPPQGIVMLTFTKKAAEEMRQRLCAIDPSYADVRAGTFHSIAMNMLRDAGWAGGRITVLDQDEDAAEMAQFMREATGRALKKEDSEQFDILYAGYHRFVDIGEDGEQDALDDEDTAGAIKYFNLDRDSFAALCRGFDDMKLSKGMLAYDDFARRLCDHIGHEGNGAGDAIRASIGHLFVDEYQDTDRAQAKMANLLAEHNANILVVGDAKQSIYAWRGANAKSFQDFRDRWEPEEIALVRNYRCAPEIVNTVNAIIAARNDGEPLLSPTRPAGGMARLGHAQDEQESTWKTMEVIRKAPEQDSVGVLFRSHTYGASAELQLELAKHRIPFRLVGGFDVTQYALFKAGKALMRVVDRPDWQMPWHRLLTMFPNVGPVAATAACADLSQVKDMAQAVKVLEHHSREAKGRARAGFAQAAAVMGKLDRAGIADKGRCDGGCSPQILRSVLGEFVWLVNKRDLATFPPDLYQQCMAKRQPRDIKAYYTPLSALSKLHTHYSTIATALESLGVDDPVEPDDSVRLTLTTIHGAKGKEFDHVVMPELEEGKCPGKKVVRLGPDGKETLAYIEERNVFFVAASRARKTLHFLCPPGNPSSFLTEIGDPATHGPVSRTCQDGPK